MSDAKDWVSGITQGIVANALWTGLAGAVALGAAVFALMQGSRSAVEPDRWPLHIQSVCQCCMSAIQRTP
jgi:hypothetical protein